MPQLNPLTFTLSYSLIRSLTLSRSATKKKPTPSSGAAAKVAVKKTIAPRTTNSGIQKVVLVSFELGDFLGAPQVSRSEAVKKVWAYIKLQNLQRYHLP
ncbi:hypothetical protein glysoja_038920 [Glycine soja]|uniref:DM2 domain-containing protein n=1 Tax=Glycine soja TaxID=3848 RepID=A0A0B2P1B5_GLYSO|nr:hypothetical protein glysoja_038920 [Glycine soja]